MIKPERRDATISSLSSCSKITNKNQQFRGETKSPPATVYKNRYTAMARQKKERERRMKMNWKKILGDLNWKELKEKEVLTTIKSLVASGSILKGGVDLIKSIGVIAAEAGTFVAAGAFVSLMGTQALFVKIIDKYFRKQLLNNTINEAADEATKRALKIVVASSIVAKSGENSVESVEKFIKETIKELKKIDFQLAEKLEREINLF